MKQRAFSLIELMAVMAIIAIIALLTLPAFNGLGKAQAMTSAGSSLLDQLAAARQTAVAQNRVVEVRLYKRRENPAQPVSTANAERFRAFRTMIYDENVLNAFAHTTMQEFPARVVLNETPKYSTLIYPYPKDNPVGYGGRLSIKPTTAGYSDDTGLEYQVIRFKPTGRTDLLETGTPSAGAAPDAGTNGDRWFLTIQSENPEKDVPTGRPSNNYFTLILDPVSGRVRIYRP